MIMQHSKNNKSKRILVLILLAINLSLLNFIFMNLNFSKEDEVFSFQDDNLRLANYPTSFNGTGENINITLHQSYLNTFFNTPLNASDSNNNKFILPCPTDTNFNSSYTNITINDIYAPNRIINIEEGTSISEPIDTYDWAFSFTVLGNGTLNNFTMCFTEDHPTEKNATIGVYLYSAIWDTTEKEMKPNTWLADLVDPYQIDDGSSAVWYNFTNLNTDLDVSKTNNNTFFIYIHQNTPDTQARVRFHYEDDGSTDDSLAWMDWGSSTWSFYTYDPSLKVFLDPLDNNPLPSQIKMKINNYPVLDTLGGSGYWESTDVNSSGSGKLHYVVSANWWDVTCNIAQVQINYTKTDLQATSKFNIAESGSTVNWNASIVNLDDFNSTFSQYWINFTVPVIWSNFKAFNDTIELTDNTTLGPPINKYREYQIYNASNGPNWYITAESANLLNEINIFVDSVKYYNYTVNYDKTIDILGNFSEVIKDGKAIIEVYSPDFTGNYLNHTNYNDTITATKEVSLGNWTIKNNATDYGVFITRMGWNNGTAAGFLIDSLTILGISDLVPSLPDDVFYANEKFNITVYFNDTGQEKGVIDGDISYSIEGSTFSTDNVTNLQDGNYTITIDCNDTRFNGYGLNTVEIHANRSFFNNQSKMVQFTILGNTTLNYYNFVNGSYYNSSQYFNITIKYYDEIKELGIDDANINYSLNGGVDWRQDNIENLGNGQYNITIYCNDINFTNYGPQIILVNVNKSFYENQSIRFDITITGDTGLTFTKLPDKSFYYSDEIFTMTAYYYDTSRNEGITGASIEVDIEGEGSYDSKYILESGSGNYDITVNCSEPIFDRYGSFNLIINGSKQNYYDFLNTSAQIIIGNTTLEVLDPSDGSIFIDRQTFNITIQYNDVVKDEGIANAWINYSLNGGLNWRYDSWTYIGEGKYNLTIDCNDPQFISFGFINIIINASKQNYNNLSRTLTIHRQITTTIEPLNNVDLGSVIRGLNVSYTFNYTDYTKTPIIGANWTRVSPFYGFDVFLKDWVNGTYTIHLNTTNVDVSGSPYTYIFTISAIGNETQTISLIIDVTIIETQIENLVWNPLIARNSGLNQTIRFYFNDTINNKAILGLITNNIKVTNYATGTIWDRGDFNWRLIDLWNNGTYILDVSTKGLDSGSYTLGLNVSKFPNYDVRLAYIPFYLRGNYTQFNLISISDPGGALTSISSGHHYRIFKGSVINLEYSISDLEFNNNTVTQAASSYYVSYRNLNTGAIGSLQSNIQFVYPNHDGTVSTSISELVAGNYLINIATALSNYENATFTFNLTIIEKYNVRFTVLDIPTEVTAGNVFNITILAEYYDGTVWLPLIGENIIVTPYFDGVAGDSINPIFTNSSGIYIFQIPTRTDAMNITLIVEIQITYNHLGDTLEISDIILNPPPAGLTFEDLLPYLIMIGAAVAVVGASLGVYRGVVVPKKREKARILTEVKTIFDDAINLEHVLVLHKGTGTCVYFKSFGSEAIDPELISGFISAISSFGKDLVSQEELNEISYGDKMLLLSDGEFIRIALVLSKKASIILRKNLKELISFFEKTYENELPTWRGQLNIFRDAGILIDEVLNTSIILPHEITYEFSNIKALKISHSRDVHKIANSLIKDSERNFFFIATLLKEASEKSSKDTAEIFMGIKELRDMKILMPIEISAIEAPPISQQEINLINQKVASLIDLSPEEKQKLVNDLAQMGPAEREAYFASLTERQEIVSAPIEAKPGAALIENVKEAKKEIKKLNKIAREKLDKKDFDKSIEIFQNAAQIALNWDLSREFTVLDDIMRKIKIKDLKIKMKKLENEAKTAAKEEKYSEAAQKYKMSSKIASEIFKLGVTEMTKEVKRLTNKAKEYEKLV